MAGVITRRSDEVGLPVGAPARELLDTVPDPRFDAIVGLAARFFNVPMAALIALDQDQTFVKSSFGPLPPGFAVQLPAVCLQATSPNCAPAMPKTTVDAHPWHATLLTGAPDISFYADVPLCTLDGRTLGVLCLLDTAPRSFSAQQIEMLTDLALCAASLLELHHSAAELRESEAHHRQALSTRTLLPWVADRDGRLLPISPRIAAAYGPLPDGLRNGDWLRAVHPDDRWWAEARWAESVAAFRPINLELRMLSPGGAYRWFQCHGALRRDSQGAIGCWYGTLEDITETRSQAEQARFLADHDALTGLFNRGRISRMLGQRATPGSAPFALFKLDVDNLKGINNTRGMAAGDAVLKEAARRLRACLRPEDLLGRSDGDEFMLVASDLARPEEAGMLAARIEAAFQAPSLIDGQPLAIGVSIGIALWPQDGIDLDTLLPNAALALARAKAEGRATFRFFRAQTDEGTRTRQALKLDLAEALERGELALAFQPQFDLRTGRLDGFEALLRWHHPARGSISPAEFIPLAEESGLIVAIGRWALEQACRAAAQWPATLSVAVNLSSIQFGRGQNLVWTVAMALAAAGLAASRLELEITESVPLLDDDRNLEALRQLRTLGVRIALDDFGSGYSSLAYLQCFAFDKLKIDRTIIARIAEAEKSRAVLRAILGMARSLGMSVTAEGVEDGKQADCLREEGCDQVQGFFYSPPVAAADVADAIATRAA